MAVLFQLLQLLALGQVVARTCNTCNTCNKPVKSSSFDQDAERGKIFSVLSEDEIRDVIQWMHSSSNLDLQDYDNATMNENYIWQVALAEPNKARALKYLSTGCNKPDRTARVWLNMGKEITPDQREYLVGPIPTGQHTTLRPFAYRGVTKVPYNGRYSNAKEVAVVGNLVATTALSIDDELRDSYGCSYADCMTWTNTAPYGPKRHLIAWIVFKVTGYYANPTGLTMSFDLGGNNESKYKLILLTYNGQAYKSVKAFKTAYHSSCLFKKIPNRPLLQYLTNSTYGLEWASLKKAPNPAGIHTGPGGFKTRPNSNIVAPQLKEPGGKRFVTKDNHVEYLGWTFEWSHSPVSGPKIFNVRYKHRLVAYQISLSEAVTVYSGNVDVVQAGTVYGDTAFNMGAALGELVSGVDCPSTALFLNVSFLLNAADPTTKARSLCIFEAANLSPQRRHYDETDSSYGGLEGTFLTVRQILPTYNYDYLIDHVFHTNGAIEIRGSVMGYLQSTFWSDFLKEDLNKYGTRIHYATAGTLHQHILSFKVDLDVGGTSNSLSKTAIGKEKLVPTSANGLVYSSVLSSFEVADDYTTKTIESSTVGRERGFAVDDEATYGVSNPSIVNTWGKTCTYTVETKDIEKNLVAHTKSLKAYSITKYSLAATVRKESEPEISSIYDQSDTTGTLFGYQPTGQGHPQPLVDVDQFIDGESLVDADIVLWVNMGVVHNPASDDVPITHTIGDSISITITPTNCFDFDDSMDLGNSVYATAGEALEVYDLLDQSHNICLNTPVYAPLGEGYFNQTSD